MLAPVDMSIFLFLDRYKTGNRLALFIKRFVFSQGSLWSSRPWRLLLSSQIKPGWFKYFKVECWWSALSSTSWERFNIVSCVWPCHSSLYMAAWPQWNIRNKWCWNLTWKYIYGIISEGKTETVLPSGRLSRAETGAAWHNWWTRTLSCEGKVYNLTCGTVHVTDTLAVLVTRYPTGLSTLMNVWALGIWRWLS